MSKFLLSRHKTHVPELLEMVDILYDCGFSATESATLIRDYDNNFCLKFKLKRFAFGN